MLELDGFQPFSWVVRVTFFEPCFR